MSQVPVRYNNYFTGTGTRDTWSVNLKACERQPGSYHEELLTNATIIRDLSTDPIHLMYSGGIDSEYILEIFLSLGIKIIPVIVKLTPNYNEYDFTFATQYCEQRGLTPTIIDINFDQFVISGRFKELATKTSCPVYQYPALFDAMERLDGTIILGSDEPHFARKDNMWIYDEMERIYTITRWFELTGYSGTPAFLNWSAETLLAFQNISQIRDLFNNRWPGRMGSNFLKNQIYNLSYSIATRDKKDGYEAIRASNIFQHPDIQSVVSDPMDGTINNNGYWYIEQQELRLLLEKNL